MNDKIIELGGINGGKGWDCHIQDKVHDPKGVAPTLAYGHGVVPMILNTHDMENDNKVIEVGGLKGGTGWDCHKQDRVYSADGVSPALTTMSGGGLEPKILTQTRTEYGKQVSKDYEKGEVQEKWGNMKEFTPREDGLTNTLTSVQKDNLVLLSEEEGRKQALEETKERVREKRGNTGSAIMQENGNISSFWEKDGKQFPLAEDMASNEQNESIAITSNVRHNVYGKTTKYRIRRLTERECFRLMDVDEADIDKIQAAGISGTQQYKMAGNSIVVSCLYHLFRKMFVQPGNEERQLSLF